MNPGVGVLNEKKKVLRDDKRGKGRDCPQNGDPPVFFHQKTGKSPQRRARVYGSRNVYTSRNS